MTTDDVHVTLAKLVLSNEPNEEDGLALMILFHTHCIRFKGVILDNRPGISELAAITQRHAAEAIAQSWPDSSDKRRTDRRHWYYQFNVRTPYEIVEDIPAEWMQRVGQFREVLLKIPFVESVNPED